MLTVLYMPNLATPHHYDATVAFCYLQLQRYFDEMTTFSNLPDALA
jgi:hypothetical protein